MSVWSVDEHVLMLRRYEEGWCWDDITKDVNKAHKTNRSKRACEAQLHNLIHKETAYFTARWKALCPLLNMTSHTKCKNKFTNMTRARLGGNRRVDDMWSVEEHVLMLRRYEEGWCWRDIADDVNKAHKNNKSMSACQGQFQSLIRRESAFITARWKAIAPHFNMTTHTKCKTKFTNLSQSRGHDRHRSDDLWSLDDHVLLLRRFEEGWCWDDITKDVNKVHKNNRSCGACRHQLYDLIYRESPHITARWKALCPHFNMTSHTKCKNRFIKMAPGRGGRYVDDPWSVDEQVLMLRRYVEGWCWQDITGDVNKTHKNNRSYEACKAHLYDLIRKDSPQCAARWKAICPHFNMTSHTKCKNKFKSMTKARAGSGGGFHGDNPWSVDEQVLILRRYEEGWG